MLSLLVPRHILRCALGLAAAATLAHTGCVNSDLEGDYSFTQIHGNDDRRDYYELDADSPARALFSQVALQVDLREAVLPEADEDGYVELAAQDWTHREFHLRGRVVREPICADEPFRGQPQITGGGCSAFLVGPDLMATAGHCTDAMYGGVPCDEMAFVFNHHLATKDHNLRRAREKDIYRCKRLEVSRLTAAYHPFSRGGIAQEDYALVRLDREVKGVTPVAVSSTGPTAGTEVHNIGFPIILPAKYSGNGALRSVPASRHQPNQFTADLDIFPGNSGSAALQVKDGAFEAVGIISATLHRDFVHTTRNRQGCWATQVYSQREENHLGTRVTSTTVVASAMKLVHKKASEVTASLADDALPAPVPDADKDGPGSVSRTFTVEDEVVAGQVLVAIDIAAPQASDAEVVLSHGETEVVIGTPEHFYGQQNIREVLATDGFAGQPAAGEWTLTVRDVENQDEMAFLSATLRIRPAPEKAPDQQAPDQQAPDQQAPDQQAPAPPPETEDE